MSSEEPSPLHPAWQTPEQLAAEMSQPVRWVKQQMASGHIPSIKIGSRRFFTPECRAMLVERQLERQRPHLTEAERTALSWERPIRRRPPPHIDS